MSDDLSNVDLIIFGSCVSRDAYADRTPGIHYIARSSLVSAFSEPFFIPDSMINHQALSPWNQKMVKTDCFSQASKIIGNQKTQTAIIDLVDERFKVYVREDRAATASVQFNQIKGDVIAEKRGYRALSIYDEDHFELWKKGADQLIALLQESCQRILFNNIKFGSVDTNGKEIQPTLSENYNRAIEPYNTHLIEAHGCEQIHDAEYSFVVDPEHRWGAAPFHYTSDVYDRIRSKVAGHI